MIYAIGDIHGHYDKLRDAHALIEEDRALYGDDDTPIVHIGDLCDRGPQTRQVIQYLLEGVQARKEWVVLKGNHDQMFLVRACRHSPRLSAGCAGRRRFAVDTRRVSLASGCP